MIPARLDSTRLPQKNLQRIGGRTLVEHALASVPSDLAPPWLNSPDEALWMFGEQQGAHIHRRPKALGSHDTRTAEILREFLEAHPCDYLVVLNPTSPLIRPETVTRFRRTLETGAMATLASVRPVRTHLLDSSLDPLNFRADTDPRTQDLRPTYAAAWALMGWRVRDFLEQGTWARPIGAFVIPEDEAVDIDTQEDLDYARYLYGKRTEPGA